MKINKIVGYDAIITFHPLDERAVYIRSTDRCVVFNFAKFCDFKPEIVAECILGAKYKDGVPYVKYEKEKAFLILSLKLRFPVGIKLLSMAILLFMQDFLHIINYDLGLCTALVPLCALIAMAGNIYPEATRVLDFICKYSPY